MKIPMAPPPLQQLADSLFSQENAAERYMKIMNVAADPAPGGRYRHWDKLRYLTPPDDLTTEEWWLGVKMVRRALYRALPLVDRDGNAFKYAMVDPGLGMLHEVDKQASGAIKGSDQVTDPQTRDTYLIKSLVEESITSSQLEGASTTREVAKDMLQRGRAPRDRSEQMIHNNYQAMLFIGKLKGLSLTPERIFELHRILTQDALDDPTAAGRFRRDDENICVVDETGHTLHVPPAADELPERLRKLCAFANDQGEQPFIHPVIRAILLHFWLAYDHPFVDGNGRTARALFYWSMAREDYWLCEYISISRVLRKAPGRYSRAYLYTETDDNDTTYFILHQLGVVIDAIRELHTYLARKTLELKKTRELVQRSQSLNTMLNHRQLALINHALRNPHFSYTIDSHRRAHAVSYQTARTDLLQLAEMQLLDQGKAGKAYIFAAPPDLRQRLGWLSGGDDGDVRPAGSA